MEKIGIYIDWENFYHRGGKKMRFDVFSEFAVRGEGVVIRKNVYVSFDRELALRNFDYRDRTKALFSMLRGSGYKVIEKIVKWYEDDQGNKVSKANADLDMAVDILLQSPKLDRVVLGTGDGDFSKVVTAIQNMGCRVEIIGFESVSKELRCEADAFFSGFFVPNLLPLARSKEGQDSSEEVRWGRLGSRVRGYCHYFKEPNRSYGFLRYMGDTKEFANLIYRDVYAAIEDFKDRNIVRELPSRDYVFEFDLHEAEEGKTENMRARNIEMIYKY